MSGIEQSLLHHLMAGAAVVAVAAATPAQAQTRMFNVPAQAASKGIPEFAKQAGVQILASGNLVAGRKTNAVRGSYTIEEGLRILLRGTGLAPGKADGTGIIAIRSAEGNAGAAETAASSGEGDQPAGAGNVILVTGTNIRGIAPASSPAKVYTREDIGKSGAATAQEFIDKLPENFGGGANAAVPAGLPNDSSAGANSGGFGSYGASVNLRGLGSGSTLVLLNGHRMAPSSVFGDFADISMIPVSAIQRVETMTDGASSIYGSDAVAGVVNFILRDDFDGLETSVRYGTGTEGRTPGQFRASVTGGKAWGSGHALLTYEYFNQQHLGVEDRRFAVQTYAPSYLLPNQRRNSLFGTVAQDVGSALSVHADALFSKRASRQFRKDFTGQSFQYDASSEALNLSAGGSWRMGKGWFLDLSGVYGRVDTRNATSVFYDELRKSKSDEWNFDAKVAGPVVSLPAGDARIALGGQYRRESLTSLDVTGGLVDRAADRNVYSAYGEAFVPLVAPRNNVPGIRRLELNLSGRYSKYSDFGSTVDPKIGVLLSPLNGLNLRGSYSTSFKAPALGQVGAHDLGASLLPTSFLFQIFGLTPADPSLANVVQLTLGGTDKNLKPEISRSLTAGFDYSQNWGPHHVRASATWFDIDYRNRLGNVPIPGNVINFDAINIAFRDPSAFPAGSYTFHPSNAEIDALLSSLDAPVANPFHLNPYNTYFISRVLLVKNIGKSAVRGIDFGLSYSYALPAATLDIGLDGTYLAKFDRQATPVSPVVPQINTLFNPVDLRMRGHLGYSAGNVSASLFVNYTDSYKVDNTASAATIPSWTTVDLTVTLDTARNLGPRVLRNTALRLAVSNIFDTAPPPIPLFSSLRVDGYDPTNASPLGRFVSLELIKRF